HEPWLMPVAADNRARAADRRAGAQSYLPVLRRRRLARHLDAARPRRARRQHRSGAAAEVVEANQPALVSRSRARSTDAARLRPVRPDLSARLIRRPGA